MIQYQTRKRSGKAYKMAMDAFTKQFKDVVKILRIYVNDAGKVYAADWLDSKGVHNFNAGFAPDVAIQVDFED